jgi:hypothetical protein
MSSGKVKRAVKKASKESEKTIQKRILNWLKSKDVLHWRQNAGTLFVGTPGKGGRCIRLGDAGLPDIILVVPPNGSMVGLEVKSATGRIRPAQKEFADKLTKNGGSYYIVRSLVDAMNALKEVYNDYKA